MRELPHPNGRKVFLFDCNNLHKQPLGGLNHQKYLEQEKQNTGEHKRDYNPEGAGTPCEVFDPQDKSDRNKKQERR